MCNAVYCQFVMKDKTEIDLWTVAVSVSLSHHTLYVLFPSTCYHQFHLAFAPSTAGRFFMLIRHEHKGNVINILIYHMIRPWPIIAHQEFYLSIAGFDSILIETISSTRCVHA